MKWFFSIKENYNMFILHGTQGKTTIYGILLDDQGKTTKDKGKNKIIVFSKKILQWWNPLLKESSALVTFF